MKKIPLLKLSSGSVSVLLTACGVMLSSQSAHAVPSFARQTGSDCAACHVGSYGPQLTPYGVKFKLGGYTDTDGKDGKVPLSAMLVSSITHTARDQAEAPTPHTNTNDNATVDEASIFLAGRLTDQIGAFIQGTYDGNERNTALDQMDIRFARATELAGHSVTYGLSLNNNPGVQDPFNTMSVWGFPYTGSALAFGTGDASTLINGGLEQHVTGLSAYAYLDNAWYAELGTYRSLPVNMQVRFGLGKEDDPGRLSNGTAYWRLAYFRDQKYQAFSAGLFGLSTAIHPDRSASAVNRYNDIGVDASYQFLGNRQHIATVNTSYTHEAQTRNQLLAAGEAEKRTGDLNEFRLNASYTYDQTWGLAAGRFSTRGNSDNLLYADGFSQGSPNTSGYVVEANWTPWGKEDSWGAPLANVRLGLQYTLYDTFNGARTNYDGNGRDASDNNTLFFYVWTSL